MIDAHAHLTDPRFADDVAAVVARAKDAGVTRILSCAEDVADAERLLALARRFPDVRVAVGIHPHRSASCDDAAIQRLRELAADPLVVAIGEIGLDFSGRSAPRQAQEHALLSQLALACELSLPIVLHVRDAGQDARAAIDGAGEIAGQLHCFSEDASAVEDWAARGFWISFAGTVTFPANDALREAVRLVSPERLLLETDAPYLAPEPHRGERNEPSLVARIYERVAAVREVTPDELDAQIARNAAALFGPRW